METKNLLNGKIGFEVKDIKDILAAKSLGMGICDEDAYYFDEYIIEEDEDGEEVDREPTDNEITNRIIEGMKDGAKIYATCRVPKGFTLVNDTNTTLQSDLFVGQHAFAMVDNKITEVRIIYISLSKGDVSKGDMDSALADVAEKLYYTIGFCFKSSLESYVPSDKEKVIKNSVRKYAMGNQVIACYSKNNNAIYDTFPLEEVFATKEELVKHLMEE